VTGILVAYLHFLGVAGLFAALTAELLLFRPDLDLAAQRRLALLDLGYGGVATLVLVTGIARMFLTGKGVGFYFGNPVFHLMGGLFLLAALLSLYPTRKFVARWRALRIGRSEPLSALVAMRIRRILWVELVLLALAMWAAVLMARGVGLG
jgi:putative membrane protein